MLPDEKQTLMPPSRRFRISSQGVTYQLAWPAVVAMVPAVFLLFSQEFFFRGIEDGVGVSVPAGARGCFTASKGHVSQSQHVSSVSTLLDDGSLASGPPILTKELPHGE